MNTELEQYIASLTLAAKKQEKSALRFLHLPDIDRCEEHYDPYPVSQADEQLADFDRTEARAINSGGF